MDKNIPNLIEEIENELNKKLDYVEEAKRRFEAGAVGSMQPVIARLRGKLDILYYLNGDTNEY